MPDESDPTKDGPTPESWSGDEWSQSTTSGVLRRRRLVFVAAIAGVTVLAAVLTAIGGLGGSGPSAAAASAVRTATVSTLADHSASVAITGSITASGQLVNLTGSGVLDFTNSLADLTVSTSSSSSSLVEHEMMSGTQMYLSISGGGQSISNVVPGKTWVLYSLPAVSSPAIGSGVGNPITQIQMLTAKGNAVSSLGLSTIDGTSVAGYSIVPNAALIAQREERFLASSGFTGAQLSMARQVSKAMGNLHFNVWIDSSNLLRRMTFSAGGTVRGAAFSEEMRMDLSNFGAPVTVAIPSADQVVSLKDFMAAANQLNGNAG